MPGGQFQTQRLTVPDPLCAVTAPFNRLLQKPDCHIGVKLCYIFFRITLLQILASQVINQTYQWFHLFDS